MSYYDRTLDKSAYQEYLDGVNRSGALHVDPNYLPPYTSPVGTQDMTKHYEKIFSEAHDATNDLNRYNKGDDEYWDEYINTMRDERTDRILSDIENSKKEEYTITVSKDGSRVSINLSRYDALMLMEELGKKDKLYDYASQSIRRLLKDFFVQNKDITGMSSPF
jgi:PHD/YefM family antitoxin component YafN of YafNO toxin-antitoxin module